MASMPASATADKRFRSEKTDLLRLRLRGPLLSPVTSLDAHQAFIFDCQ